MGIYRSASFLLILVLEATLLMVEATTTQSAFKFHVAPLQGYTDQHLRYLYRLMAPRAVLWTEMLKPADLLDISPYNREMLLTRGHEMGLYADTGNSNKKMLIAAVEKNLLPGLLETKECVLQLGDNDANRLVMAAKAGLDHGYTQIDLNCGCPSAKTDANFGCSLMRDGGALVAELTDRLAEAVNGKVPISVKCRIGVHETNSERVEDSFEVLHKFVSKVTKSGAVKDVAVHARSGVLQGFSPTKNREIPPLRPDLVLRLADEFRGVAVTLNGGVKSVREVVEYSRTNSLSGVMSGRWMLRRPFDLALLHDALYPEYSSSVYQRLGIVKTTTKTITTSITTTTQSQQQQQQQHSEVRKRVISAYIDYARLKLMTGRREEAAAVIRPIAILWYSLWQEYEELCERSYEYKDRPQVAGGDVIPNSNSIIEEGNKYYEGVSYSSCSIEDTKEVSIHLMELTQSLLATYCRIETASKITYALSLDSSSSGSSEPPPYKKFGQLLESVLSKKVMTKLKQNCGETYF